MDTAQIRQKLYDYISHADDRKVKAIYTIIESDINQVNEWWKDDELISEIEKRASNLKSGEDKGVSWDDLKNELAK